MCRKMDRLKWSNKIIVLALSVLIIAGILLFAINERYKQDDSEYKNSATSTEPFVSELAGRNSAQNSAELDDQSQSAIQSTRAQNKSVEGSTNFRLIVLAPNDQKAVVLDEKGLTQVVTIGDRIGNEEYEVLQVTSDKLVIKHPNNGSMLWLFEGQGESPGRIQTFSSQLQGSEEPSGISTRSAESNETE